MKIDRKCVPISFDKGGLFIIRHFALSSYLFESIDTFAFHIQHVRRNVHLFFEQGRLRRPAGAFLSKDALDVLRALGHERCEGLLPRVRRGTHLRLLRRWWGLLSIAAQRVVARAVSQETAADLPETPLESVPGIADLA